MSYRSLLIFGCLLLALVPLANCNGWGDRAGWNSTDGGRRRQDDRHGAGGSGVANTCAGTTQGFSTGKNATAVYLDYKAMYTNCTYVLSNLEIVLNADDRTQFDFSFLSGIREVKGYVLVYTTNMVHLQLSNLTIIRGEQLLFDTVQNSYNSNFSLLIKFNARLRYLHLSSLKEISNGNVGLIMNGALSCHTFSSVDWQYLFSLDSQSNISIPMSNQSLTCAAADVCHSSCETKQATASGEKHCWGPEAAQCQPVIRCSTECQPSSGGSGVARGLRRRARCFGPDWNQCCHPECIGSCTGPYDHSCLACRNFKNDNQCVPSCPDPKVYDPNTYKFVDNPQKKYALGSFCVRKCPDNYAVFDKGCVISCPGGFTINATGNDGFCEKCNGPCPKDCQVDYDADRDLSVNSDNIMDLANCTRITGNLVFPMDVFEPHRPFSRRRSVNLSGSRELNLTDLALLGTVKAVTGYILIQSSVPWLTNLEFLGNLEEIGGTKKYNGYSLVVSGQNITHLGLRSLQRIKDGGVSLDIGNNCYTNQTALQSLFHSRSSRLSVVVAGPPCSDSLCDIQCKDKQCWGPGPLMCLRCNSFAAADGRTCVTNCSSRAGEYEPPAARPGQGQKCGACHEECLAVSGCTGPTDGNCKACRNVRDGPYCRRSCPERKFTDATRSCQACHPYCRDGCTGSSPLVSPIGCTNCFVAQATMPRIAEYKVTECLAPNLTVCPPGHFLSPVLRKLLSVHAGTSQFCIPCERQCESCSFYGQCLTCKGVETDSNEDDSTDSEVAVQCATTCPPLNYVELLPARQPGSSHKRRVCRPCSALCLDGCRGPTAADCLRCNGKQLYLNGTANFTCVEKCPEDAQYTKKDELDQDVCSHVDPAVALREQAEKKSVPAIIGGVIGGFVLVLGAALAIACVCRQRAAAREKSRRYEAKMMGMAMSTESLNLTDAPPDLARLRLIKESEIRRGCVIGSGAFGTVYKGVWLPEGEGVTLPVAIKVLQEGTTPEQNKELLEEARIMATVMHPCCVRLIAVCLTSPMMLLTQLMPNGCLLEYVRKNKANIGSKALLDWCTQIAMGMEYLESRGIVHRDLAARNVLVQNSCQVKITDFGLAKVLEYNADQYEATSGKMPIKWMALESIMDRIFTHKTDVWGYGVTLWELFTYGQRPYDGVRAYDMPQLLERGERLSQPTICTIDVYMILVKCWMLDADSRPPFSDLVADFSRMSKDPGRYLVIAGDRLMKLNSVSYTARDLLEDDVDLAAAVAEEGSKVMDLDEYLQPATVASTTSDGSGTSALDRAVSNRTSDVKSLPGYPVGKDMSDKTKSRSSVDSRYGPAPARLAASEELDEAAAEQQPFLPAVDESGYLQPQPTSPVEDYLNPSTTRGQYLDVIPEDDLGFAKDKRNSRSPNGTSAGGDVATDGELMAAPLSLAPARPLSSPAGAAGAAAAAPSSSPTGSTNIDNPEYYLSRKSAALPSADPATTGLVNTAPA